MKPKTKRKVPVDDLVDAVNGRHPGTTSTGADLPPTADAPDGHVVTSRPWAPPARSADPPEYQPGNSRPATGRLAVHVQRRRVEWLIPDLIPREMLTFIVGDPDAGKSSFGAWLCSQARRPAILPGFEESVESQLVPRLAANQVRLESTLILDGRLWSMPHDRQALIDALRYHAADLLWIDPIDSYVGECSEIDGDGVRAALEALVSVAQRVPCSVVAARHPGKAAGNICPGSRQWRAVPRQILHLKMDEGPPLRRFLRVAKEPSGQRPPPHECHIGGEPGEPGRFTLGPAIDPATWNGTDEADQVERWKIDDAGAFLLAILKEGALDSIEVYKRGEAERFTDRTLRRAAKKVGVEIQRTGNGREHKSEWKVIHSGTLAKPLIDTQRPESTSAEGVSISDGQSARVEKTAKKKGGKSRAKTTS